ncbi:MAG: GAF domain-containing protein, partial [Candidatus Eisenbacteria bacterium]
MHRILARFVRRHRAALAAVIAQRLASALAPHPALAEAKALLDALQGALETGDVDAVTRVLVDTDRRWEAFGVRGVDAASALLGGEAATRQETGLDGPAIELLESVPLPIAFVDRAGLVTVVNAPFIALAGPEAAHGPVPLVALLGHDVHQRIDPLLHEGAPATSAMELVHVSLAAAPERDLLATVIPFRHRGVLTGWLITLRTVPDGMVADPALPQLLAQEKTQKEKLEALLTVSQWVTGTLDHQTVLDTIAKEVRRVVQVDECTVFMVDAASRLLHPVACDVMEFRDEVMAVRLKVGEGITGGVALSGRGEIVHDSENDPRAVSVPGTPPEESSLLCVPLIARQKVIGVITLSRIGRDRRPFVQADLELATVFAAQCSSAIHNARIYAQMKSAYDELRATQQQLVLSAKLNALGEMAGGVAHDFNNILAAILGRTQLLMRGPTSPELRRQLEVIEQAALDGAHTVRRVQEFTRVRQDERFETLDINQVIEGVVEFTRPAWFTNAKKRGVTVE